MKLYDEKEIGNILKRAAELSRTTPRNPSLGLSLEEIKELGAEAGIDPDLIAMAAAESGRARLQDEPTNWFGGPMTVTREVVFDSEVDGDEWEEMLVLIRETFGDPGIVTTRSNTQEWTGSDKETKAQVTARNRDGRCAVTVFWNAPAFGILSFVPTIVGSLISLPIVFEAMGLGGPAGFGVWALIAALLFMVSRTIAQTVRGKKQQSIDALISQMERIADQSEESRERSHTEIRNTTTRQANAKADRADIDRAHSEPDPALRLEDPDGPDEQAADGDRRTRTR